VAASTSCPILSDGNESGLRHSPMTSIEKRLEALPINDVRISGTSRLPYSLKNAHVGFSWDSDRRPLTMHRFGSGHVASETHMVRQTAGTRAAETQHRSWLHRFPIPPTGAIGHLDSYQDVRIGTISCNQVYSLPVYFVIVPVHIPSKVKPTVSSTPAVGRSLCLVVPHHGSTHAWSAI
jgi:hypothetical protein